jgi:hypothetical protein
MKPILLLLAMVCTLTACTPPIAPVAPATVQTPAPPAFTLEAGITTKGQVERQYGPPQYVSGDLAETFWLYWDTTTPDVAILVFQQGIFQRANLTTKEELRTLLQHQSPPRGPQY